MDVPRKSSLSASVSKFNNIAASHQQNQAANPFSEGSVGSTVKSNVSSEEYGRPVKGSKSERRGFQADQNVCRELLELCSIITDYGRPLFPGNPNDKRIIISFGELFDLYTVISNKLVGMLLRARKHHIVDFEGEMLFQRRDDDVPITLLKSLDEIKEILMGRIEETQAVIQSRDDDKKKK